jgi:deoxyribodipyrimidine photo-lyase
LDHAPLAAAAACDEAAVLWVVEPAWLDSPEFDPQHLAFWLACAEPLAEALRQRGFAILRRCGPMPAVLEALYAAAPFTHLFSHEETGPGWSYDRDRAVKAWCRAHGVTWQEWPQSGVVRPLTSRQGWAARWHGRMAAPLVAPPIGARPARVWRSAEGEPWPAGVTSRAAGHRPLPPAGEAAAGATLDSFLDHRGRHYRQALSSPLTAADGCSRLSVHLAFGTLSMRQVHQATEARIAALKAEDTPGAHRMAYHLRGFASRLRWHCHFMQKLEDEPAIEWRNFARGADGLRDAEPDPARLQAWCAGMTGFPMVDACMRQLNATGWLNFRMRAMLVSFAAYHLWLHWRAPGLHLARQFLDFEPGIHWSQMQMQSGTTGINTLRIYSPSRQAADHDPSGAYVRQWVPEQGTSAYPPPIVDERAALAAARARLQAWRSSAAARQEADDIQQRHGSRKSGLPPTTRAPARPGAAPARRATRPGSPLQGDLFD